MIYPKLSDGTIDWCVMCKHEGSEFYDLCCMCNYGEKEDDPPTCYESKQQTNGDRIRRMTDEELAEELSEIETGVKTYGEGVFSYLLDWLRQEAQP